MKSLIYVLILSITCIGSVTAQKTVTYTEATPGFWDQSKKTWVWGETKSTTIDITTHGSVILVGDAAKSSYFTKEQTYRKVENNILQVGWKAVDEKERNCTVVFVTDFTRKKFLYIIFYDTFAFSYGKNFE